MIFQRFNILHDAPIIPAPFTSVLGCSGAVIRYPSNSLRKILSVAALTTFILIVSSASAANHYIRAGATGSGLGTDWINAYPTVPPVLIRGDTYYIASGTYGAATFNTPTVGNAYVSLKKATEANHGTTLGWQSSYGVGQALFSSSGAVWRVNMNYLSVNGETGSDTSGHGIKLLSSGRGDGTYGIISTFNGDASSHLILNHIELAGVGPGGVGKNGNFTYGFYSNTYEGTTTDYRFSNCYVHDVYIWLVTSWADNVLIDHCYFKNAGSSDASFHGAGLTFLGDNWTLRNSTLENMLGSANTTYVEPQWHPHNVYIYGNTYRSTSPDERTTQWSVLSLTSTDGIDNLYFYNNAIYGLRGMDPGLSGGNFPGSSNVVVYNNVWEGCLNNPTLSRVDSHWNNIFNTGKTIPSVLANLSTRMRVGTGKDVLIGGFIIKGTHPKQILLRAIGPSITLPGALSDPMLELHDRTGKLIVFNDNWQSASNHNEISRTGAAPTNPLESAILVTLAPGAYTAIVRGVNNASGIALIEAYDNDLRLDAQLANISARGSVQTGNDIMIGGFITLGKDSKRMLIRATGPSLPLAGQLTNPALELRDVQGALVRSNDNWRDTQAAEIIATGIPPSNENECAIATTLSPGAYTAIVRGVHGATGLALIEVYSLN